MRGAVGNNVLTDAERLLRYVTRISCRHRGWTSAARRQRHHATCLSGIRADLTTNRASEMTSYTVLRNGALNSILRSSAPTRNGQSRCRIFTC